MEPVSPPMKWNSSVQYDPTVVDFTGWRYVNKHSHFPERAGVIVFTNEFLEVRYVEAAGFGKINEKISSAMKSGKDYDVTRMKVLYTDSDDGAYRLGQDLIERYEPPNNLK